jgi:hypothetical protein
MEQAIALAEQEVLKLGWKKNEFEVGLSGSRDGLWWVEMVNLPPTPGGHVTVEITSNGKVTVVPGL